MIYRGITVDPDGSDGWVFASLPAVAGSWLRYFSVDELVRLDPGNGIPVGQKEGVLVTVIDRMLDGQPVFTGAATEQQYEVLEAAVKRIFRRL